MKGTTNTSDRDGVVKLPDLKSVYLQHPSEKLIGNLNRVAKFNHKIKGTKVVCGLCGGNHMPGEPHKTKDIEKHLIKPQKLVPMGK